MTPQSFEDTGHAFASRSNAELKKMLWLFSVMNKPGLVRIGTAALKLAFGLHFPVKGIVKKTVFEHFCGGESIEDCERTMQKLGEFGVGTILDFSAEGTKDEAYFDTTTQEIIRTIEKAAGNPLIPFSVFKVTGIAHFDLLAKVHSEKELNEEEKEAFARVKKRVHDICSRASELDVRVLIDAEETWIQSPIDDLALEMMHEFNKEKPLIFNTYQMYCHATLLKLRAHYHKAVGGSFYIGAKLVRGAYMEKERVRAAEQGYEDPIQANKEATDTDYDKALKFCIEKINRFGLCAGTHNEYSSYYLTVLMDKYNLPKNDRRIFFAQLLGMSGHITYNLAAEGYNVCKYVPYGPVKLVMPYLIRRAEENTSVAGQTSRELTLIRKETKRRRKA